MNCADCLKEWRTERFGDAIENWLVQNENDLPLQDFCDQGGGPDPEGLPHFIFRDAKEQQGEIVVNSSVFFKESIPSACKDANITEDREGTLIIRIDKSTGTAEVETDPDSMRRNLENY
jgi:hypothetical protein